MCVGICAVGNFHCVFYSLAFYAVSQLDTDKPIERTFVQSKKKTQFKIQRKKYGLIDDCVFIAGNGHGRQR